jgi:DnaK suppressor protein
MTSKTDERLRKQLLALREELTRVMNGHLEEDRFGDVLDEADRATDLISGVMESLVTTNHQDTLKKIDEALEKVDRGVYGQCERCNGRIEEKRLGFMPFATLCIACKRALEEEGDGE